MVHLSSESKQAIVQKVLSRDNSSSMEQIAKTHNIGYSTLQPWVKDYRTGNVPVSQPVKKQAVKDVSRVDKFNHLMATASLDDVKIGSYCRKHGLFGKRTYDSKRIPAPCAGIKNINQATIMVFSA